MTAQHNTALEELRKTHKQQIAGVEKELKLARDKKVEEVCVLLDFGLIFWSSIKFACVCVCVCVFWFVYFGGLFFPQLQIRSSEEEALKKLHDEIQELRDACDREREELEQQQADVKVRAREMETNLYPNIHFFDLFFFYSLFLGFQTQSEQLATDIEALQRKKQQLAAEVKQLEQQVSSQTIIQSEQFLSTIIIFVP